MRKLSVALGALCAVTGAFAEPFHAINIVSGNPSRTAFVASEIVRQHKSLGLRSFAISQQYHVRAQKDAEVGLEAMTDAGNVATDRIIADNVDAFSRLKAALKGEDVELGILVQSSLGGHSGQKGPPADWQRSAFLNGKVSQRTCILEPKFHAYMKRAVKAMAAAKPAFILIDDDFSTRKHECCCPLHLALLSKTLGRTVDREEMQKILGERPLRDPEYIKATDAIYSAFEEMAREIRAAIDEVDPTLRCGLCSGGCMLGGLKRTALALAGPKTEPFVRFCNAVYGPQDPYTVIHTVSVAEEMRAYVAPIADILCEGDTYPHNAMSTPAVRFNAALANNALTGIGGVKLWMSDYRHDRFVDSQHRYEAIYREWEGFRMELLRLAREGIAWRGVAGIVFDPELRLAPVKRDDGIDPWYTYPMMVLAPYAVPIRFARPGAGGLFSVAAGEAKMLSKAERDLLAKGPLVLDPKCGDLFPERGAQTFVPAVSPTDPYYARFSTTARETFKAELDKLAGGVLEMSLEADEPAFVRHGLLKDGRELLAITLLCEDPLAALPIRLVRTPKTVEKLSPDGTWSPVAWSRTAPDVVTVKAGATVYAVVALRFGFPSDAASAGDGKGIADETVAIQHRLDAAAAAGGGTVRIPTGVHRVKSLRLRDGVTLHLEKEAVLLASRDPSDYVGVVPELEREGVAKALKLNAPRWENAVIRLYGARNAAIVGEEGSAIDGGNCVDLKGEEGYRGPHAISAIFCTNLVLKGYSVRDSGNWAHRLRSCENVRIEGISARGGHDGIDIHSCRHVRISNSFLDTGDDCVAGFDDRDVIVSNCTFRSACSPLRIGGRDILVTDCTADGGDYPHRWTLSKEAREAGRAARPGEGRRNMGCFFQYYTSDAYPFAAAPDNIVIRNVTVKNADLFVCSLTALGLIWNKGPGISNIRFENVRVENLRKGGVLAMPAETPLTVRLDNCSFAFRDRQDHGFDTYNVKFVASGLKTENLAGPLAVEAADKAKVPIPDTFPSWTKDDHVARRMLGLEGPAASEGADAKKTEEIAAERKGKLSAFEIAQRVTVPLTWRSANGETLPYRLHVPANPEAGRKYPLVIHMHGAGSRGTNNLDQIRTGGADFIGWAAARNEEYVFLAPQCPEGLKWVDCDWSSREHHMKERPTKFMRMAIEIIEDAIARYPVDPNRVYVMGISMGGYATWELLQRRPGIFAAALPCCGGADTACAPLVKDIAVWTFHGGADTVVPTYRSQSMTAAIRAAGGTKIVYTEYPGVGHNAWTPTFTDRKTFDWLFAQRRTCE